MYGRRNEIEFSFQGFSLLLFLYVFAIKRKYSSQQFSMKTWARHDKHSKIPIVCQHFLIRKDWKT